MGNSPSAVDAQRRAPQKLSKPRSGNSSTAGLLISSNGFVNSTGPLNDLHHHHPGFAPGPPPPPPLSYPLSPAPSPVVTSAPFPGAVASEDLPAANSRRGSFISVAPRRQHQQQQQQPQQDEQDEQDEQDDRDDQDDQDRQSQPQQPQPQPKDLFRLSLFRSRSSQRPSRQQLRDRPSRRHSSIVPSQSRKGDQLARTHSMTYEPASSPYYGGALAENWPSAGSRTSWNYDLSSYEAKRLLNLVEEPTSFEQSSAMSESKFTVVSETTWKSSHPAQPESTSLSRANSELSMYTPVRRRSIIQTPGVATRTNSFSTQTRPNFRHSHPPTPSLSRQASFESTGSRVLSMPPLLAEPDAAPRVVTPCEGDYKTIGAFKLGSLRITNGSVSPSASPELDRSHPVEASSSADTRAKFDYFVSTQKLAAAAASDSRDARPGNLRETHLSILSPRPISKQLSPIAPSFATEDTEPKAASSHGGHSDADAAPQPDYLADLKFSPFSLDDAAAASAAPAVADSPHLQTTSKHTALEDDLFEDEGQPEYSSAEVLDVRLDPNAKSKLEAPKADGPDPSVRSVSRTDSGVVSSPVSDFSHKPLSKADSGYSSNVSLRSLKSSSKPLVPEKDLTPPAVKSPQRDSFYIAELKLPSPTILTTTLTTTEIVIETTSSPPAAPVREAPPPPPPPKDYPPVSPVTRSASSLGRDSPAGGRPHLAVLTNPSAIKRRPIPEPLTSIRSRESGVKSPDLTPMSPASAVSDGSASALSIGSGSQKPGKLQRLLSLSSSSKGPPTVHATHVQEKADIPAVPQEVEAKLHEHTGLFPITTKRLALKTQLSKDTLKTIFSVGSVDTHHIDPQPASVVTPLDNSDASSTDTKISGLRHTFQAVPSSIAHVAAAMLPMRKQPVVRKPVPASSKHHDKHDKHQKKETEVDTVVAENVLDVEAELATYSSVNNSLGNNPYDAAFMAMQEARDAYFSPKGRAMSMTAQLERSLDMRMAVTKSRSVTSEAAMLSPGLPSPSFPEMFTPKKTKTPPPVSMRTQRRPNSLRIPPPLRPQSTPPGPARPPSRTSSRESLRSSYPPNQPPNRSDTISPPAIPPMNPRRSIQLIRDPRSPTSRSPNWEVRTDHGAARRASVDQGRANSLLSRSIASPSQGPQGYGGQSLKPPPLRHRASHDGFSNGQRQSWGGYGQPSNGGYAKPSPSFDPWSNNGQGLASQYQDQSRQHPPPYVPRGHYRNRSMGNRQAPGQPPYRILHSYNSPAYRGVPIWG